MTGLVAFARGYAVRQGQAEADEIQFHIPQYVLARTMGVHEDTIRRWLNRPEARFVVARCAHKQDGRYHRLTSGTIFSVLLDPDGARKAKLRFKRGQTLRDLEKARLEGRVRDTYSPEGKTLLQALEDWAYPVMPIPRREPPTVEARTPVEILPMTPEDDVRDALSMPSPERVERAAHAIRCALGDSISYLPAWCRVLWRLARRGEREQYLFTQTFIRFRHAYTEGLRCAAAGLMLEAQVAGWR